LHIVLCIPCIPDNRFTTLNQQNAQTYSLDICIVIPHLIFLHVSIRKSDLFSLPLYDFVRIPDDGPSRLETCKDVKCDIVLDIYIIIQHLIFLHVSIRKSNSYGLPLYAFVRIPDDGPLRPETCKEVMCYNLIYVSK